MVNFSTKARTLEAFSPLLNKSTICESVYFTVNEWSNSSHEIIKIMKSAPDIGSTAILL